MMKVCFLMVFTLYFYVLGGVLYQIAVQSLSLYLAISMS